MLYQFKYLLDDNDYLEFNKFHMYNSLSNKKAIIALRLAVPILMTINLLLFQKSYQKLETLVISIIIIAVFSIIWALLVKPLLLLVLKANIKMLKKDGKLPYGKDVLMEFGEQNFIETTKETETKTNYSQIEKITLGNTAIYIYINSIQAYIIPFSVFTGDESKEAFLTFINQKAAINIEKIKKSE